MTTTVFGLPAVEVPQPKGEPVAYLIREDGPDSWTLTKPDGTAYRVTARDRDGMALVPVKGRYWHCSCRGFTFGFRKMLATGTGCKHVAAVLKMGTEGIAANNPSAP